MTSIEKIRTNTRRRRASILLRASKGDRSASKECIEEYGNFVWALAVNFTSSTEEAEAATIEIFTDIWRHSRHAKKFRVDEPAVVSQIARCRLARYLRTDVIETKIFASKAALNTGNRLNR